jgi:hypothetical protein
MRDNYTETMQNKYATFTYVHKQKTNFTQASTRSIVIIYDQRKIRKRKYLLRPIIYFNGSNYHELSWI